MTLLVDIGNTRVKWARADSAGRPGPVQALAHDGRADWVEALPANLTGSVWFATVADADLATPLQEWSRNRLGRSAVEVVSTASAAGVQCAYPRPERLGVDRWLACIGAFHRGPGSVVVVDAGTALTVDVVDATGVHQGGLIVPGMATMQQAIHAHTRIRSQPLAQVPDDLARDTDAAVAAGALHAAVGLIERVCRRFALDRQILAGGEAALLADRLEGEWLMAPDIVLEGLGRVAAEPAADASSDGCHSR